jgi:predicted Rdx family selenoprotein
MAVIRFDEATVEATRVLQSFSAKPDLQKIVAVRDLSGVFRFVIDGSEVIRRALEAELTQREQQFGAWLPSGTTVGQTQYGRVLTRGELYDPQQVLDTKDLIPVAARAFLLDRRVVAADWRRGPLPNLAPTPPRATFYALKGGAGRSTALVYWVRHLAHTKKKRVLVVDLDLESPGISASLLPGIRPRFGVVDWYVEDAVRQADPDLLAEMTAESPIAAGAEGSVVVAPVAGDLSRDYLTKLARVYAAPPGSGDAGAFGERTARLIDDLERAVNPDVTVIDSRAGLHDVGAVSVVRLGATSFLFATDTRENWLGYTYMFAAWRRQPEVLGAFREDLQIVASLVPEVGGPQYTERLRDQAHRLFADWIYDNQTGVGGDINYGVDDSAGPHYPVGIRWNRRFFAHEPGAATVDEAFEADIRANFGAFFDRADELVLP